MTAVPEHKGPGPDPSGLSGGPQDHDKPMMNISPPSQTLSPTRKPFRERWNICSVTQNNRPCSVGHVSEPVLGSWMGSVWVCPGVGAELRLLQLSSSSSPPGNRATQVANGRDVRMAAQRMVSCRSSWAWLLGSSCVCTHSTLCVRDHPGGRSWRAHSHYTCLTSNNLGKQQCPPCLSSYS